MGVENRLRMLTRPEEVSLIIRIWRVVLVIPVLLKLFKIEKIVRIITPKRTKAIVPPLSEERVTYLCARVLGMFRGAAYPSNCLRRCLLLYHVLRYYRIPVVISFGVRLRDDVLVGHSWLVLDGRLYDDRPEHVAEFTHVFSLPPGGHGPPEAKAAGFDMSDLERIPYDD